MDKFKELNNIPKTKEVGEPSKTERLRNLRNQFHLSTLKRNYPRSRFLSH